jgi:hypothetical protein
LRASLPGPRRRRKGEQAEADRQATSLTGSCPLMAAAAAPGANRPTSLMPGGGVTDQQALDEQQPGGDADQRWHLVANDGAETDADRRPERGRRRAPREQERVVAAAQLDVDPAHPKRRGADPAASALAARPNPAPISVLARPSPRRRGHTTG